MAYRSCKRKRIIFAVLLIISYTFVIGEKTRAKPTNIESAMISHAINDDTSQMKIAKKVLLTLENTSKDLARFIKQTDGVYTKQRYNEIRKQISTIAHNLRENITSDIDVDKYLKNELNELRKIYKDIGGFSDFSIPAFEQVKKSATFVPYTESSNFDSFLENVENQFFNVWDSSVRTGYMTGQTTQEIVRNVMGSPARDAQVVKTGSLQGLRNSVVANTRTALQSFAVETRNAVYKQNEDLFDGYKWLATLDRRSCLVCGELDGKIFRNLDEIKTMPPIHLNCRCVIVPYFKELDEVEDYRASENGEVKSGVTYEEWLDSQSDEVKAQILGQGRFELYKQGMKIGDFVNNGRTIPITTPVGLSKTEENYYKNNKFLYVKGKDEANEIFDLMAVKQLNKYETIDDTVKVINPNYYKYPNNKEYRQNCQRAFIAMEMRLRGCDVLAQPCYNVKNDYIAKNLHKVFALEKSEIKVFGDINKVLEALPYYKDAYARYGLEYSYYDDNNIIKRHVIMIERQMKNLEFYDGQIGRKIDISTLKNNAFIINLYRVDNKDLTGLAKYCYFER